MCSLCRKNLGIASAGAAGLKELTQSFPGKENLRFGSFSRQGEPEHLRKS